MHGNTPINIEALLSHVPLFNGLAPAEIAKIARGTREIHQTSACAGSDSTPQGVRA